MKKTIAFISIIAIAAFVGNMINIGLGYGGYWQTLDPVAFMDDFAIKFTASLLPPTAATLLPALLATGLSLGLNWKDRTSRKLWGIALLCLVATVIQTVVYHVPVNAQFTEHTYTPAEASAALSTWLAMHWLRVGVAIGGAVFAIRATVGSGS
jgi:uncharacterized membrane protein